MRTDGTSYNRSTGLFTALNNAAPVPEPATYAFLAIGLAALILQRRRWRQRNSLGSIAAELGAQHLSCFDHRFELAEGHVARKIFHPAIRCEDHVLRPDVG
jgi:PEP-CTERM motif